MKSVEMREISSDMSFPDVVDGKNETSPDMCFPDVAEGKMSWD